MVAPNFCPRCAAFCVLVVTMDWLANMTANDVNSLSSIWFSGARSDGSILGEPSLIAAIAFGTATSINNSGSWRRSKQLRRDGFGQIILLNASGSVEAHVPCFDHEQWTGARIRLTPERSSQRFNMTAFRIELIFRRVARSHSEHWRRRARRNVLFNRLHPKINWRARFPVSAPRYAGITA
jgi:hypothetical protein